MYIVIVGAGEVGHYLGEILIDEGHDVAIVESDEKLARELDGSLDGLVVHGSGVSSASLRAAGIAKADVLLAVTHTDEVNLIAAMTATKVNKDLRAVARVRGGELLSGKNALTASELGLALIVAPELAVANEVVQLLSYDGSGEMHSLVDNRLCLLELPLSDDSPLVHESLRELTDIFPTPSLVVAIWGPRGIKIPRGDDRMAAEDRAYVITPPANADEFWILSGKPWHHVRHVLIIGAGDIGYNVAALLEKKRMFPTIIEINRERAEWVSKHLTKSLVILGDGTDPDILREQLEERSDAVVVCLGDDEKSTLVGLFAKHLGAKKVVVRSDKPDYAHIAHKLGVDALISPKRAVAHEILRFVRRGRISAAHMIGDHEGEILEYSIPLKPSHPEIMGVPLKDLSLPEGCLIGAVVHTDEVKIADGNTVLEPGDKVLIIAIPKALEAIEELLS